MKKYILDACALIAVLNKETGAESVQNILIPSNNTKVYMNIINLLEVYYGILREYGNVIADNILLKVKSSVIVITNNISDDVFKEAARLKANYKISLADSIVVAEGMTKDAIIVSSDHHEFDVLERNENIEFLWIR